MKHENRNEIVLASLRSGKTLQETGDLIGVSREYVRKIINKLGFVTGDLRPQKPEIIYTEEQLRRRFKKSADRFAKECGCDKKPSRAFQEQKTNALKRGVAFNLTFEQWWDLWKPNYKQRGCERGMLVMCRTNDEGDYSIGNVRIDGASENVKESRSRSKFMKVKKVLVNTALLV